MEDGGARRRLRFCDEPYKNKTFYIDVKTKTMRSRVSSAVIQLGGTVESFLSKDIFMFVTDAKTSRLQNCLKQNQDGSTTSTDTSFTNYSAPVETGGHNLSGVGSQNISVIRNQNISIMSRGRALLMRARENGSKDSQSTCTNNSGDCVNSTTTSAVIKAFQMGVKIEHAINFLRKCKNVGVAFKAGKKEKHDLSGFAPLKWDDKYFIKYEDESKQYRPIFRQLENVPTLYTENYGGSPFDGPMFLHRVKSETTGARKEMKGKKFTNEKGGYCEMCAIWFTGTLREHMHYSDHVNFVKNKENFSSLDILVGHLPTVGDFLAKFASRVRGCSVDNKILDTPSSDSEVFQIIEPSDAIHKGMHGLKKNNILQPVEVLGVKESAIPSNDLFPLQMFTGNKLFDSRVLNVDLDPHMFSSDLSQSESPTTVLKDLLSNWTLQDNTKLDSIADKHSSEMMSKCQMMMNVTPDVTCPPVLTDENYSGTTCSYSHSEVFDDKDLPMSLGTPLLSLGCHDDNSTSDEGQLKLKMVYVNGDPVPSTHLLCKCLPKSQKKKRKVKRKNKENINIYCSHKTSDIKLKLSKVSVTPVQQKCNLKMFWQVRKTGDCKLVFSSRKRKSNRSDSYLDAGDGEVEKEHSHRLKRQRLVF